MADIGERKLGHIEACLRHDVEFTRLRTGFDDVALPYCALPEMALSEVDLATSFLGRELRAPVLIGAMTGGTRLAGRINANLAVAAERLGIGMMLGSQRVMLREPSTVDDFRVRRYAPDIALIGNLGIAQLSTEDAVRVVETVEADALAVHTNPLQEACQPGGDTDFRDRVERLSTVASAVDFPLLLKEVGHGLSGDVARATAHVPLAALDVAGAGGTSWAKVEQLVAHGAVVSPALAEWGIPTRQALAQCRAALPERTLIASGGIRCGVDAALALKEGASLVAVARPLLAPAIDSADAVTAWLSRFVEELRVAMYCCGARTVAQLRRLP